MKKREDLIAPCTCPYCGENNSAFVSKEIAENWDILECESCGEPFVTHIKIEVQVSVHRIEA